MRVVTGQVVGGKVVVQGPPLKEGTLVTILARDRAETFQLSADQEAELLLSIAEADRGELVPAEDVLRRLPPGRI